MKKIIAVIILAVFTFTGCKTTGLKDEKANLLATEKIYKSTVSALIELRSADKIPKKVQEKLSIAINVVNDNFILWNTAINKGRSNPDLKVLIDKNLKLLTDTLIKYQEE
jgi:hypothetical protein